MAPVAEEIRPKYDIWEGSYDTAGIVDDPAVAEAFTSGRLLGHGGQVTEVLGDGHVQLDNGTRLKVRCAAAMLMAMGWRQGLVCCAGALQGWQFPKSGVGCMRLQHEASSCSNACRGSVCMPVCTALARVSALPPPLASRYSERPRPALSPNPSRPTSLCWAPATMGAGRSKTFCRRSCRPRQGERAQGSRRRQGRTTARLHPTR